MFTSLEEIIDVLSKKGYIKTSVTFSIDDLFEYSLEDLTRIVSEKVFGDFEVYLDFIEVEVCKILSCDMRSNTIELEINIDACWEDIE